MGRTAINFTFQQVALQERATYYEIEIFNVRFGASQMHKIAYLPFGPRYQSFFFDKLVPGLVYRIRVRVLNRVGAGPWTAYSTFKTLGKIY